MGWNKDRVRNPELRDELDAVFSGERMVSTVPLLEAAPATPAAAAVLLATASITQIPTGGTVAFEGKKYERAAGTTPGKWSSAAELAALLTVADVWAGSTTSGVTVTSKVKGAKFNDRILKAEFIDDTTANANGTTTPASATIRAATVAVLAAGDTVEFDGNVFTKVAATPGDNEFVDGDGLKDLIAALDDWGATISGDITITAGTNDTEFNDIDVNVTLYRKTAGGIDGTVAKAGAMAYYNGNLYVAKTDVTVEAGTWGYVTLTA